MSDSREPGGVRLAELAISSDQTLFAHGGSGTHSFIARPNYHELGERVMCYRAMCGWVSANSFRTTAQSASAVTASMQGLGSAAGTSYIHRQMQP